MPRGDELDPAPVEPHGSAEVRVEDVLHPLALDLGGDLDQGDDGRARALGDVDDVAVVVIVAVGEGDHRRLDVPGAGRGLRVAGQEGVDEHRGGAVAELKAAVAEKADVHRQSSWGLSSRCASSSPAATPTSIVSRVSSAISVRTAVWRATGSSDATALRISPWGAWPNQPDSSSAWLSMRWSCGAGDSTSRCAASIRPGSE